MSESKERLKVPKLLLIAGTQQNVGKTTLACKIITCFSREFKITAFKVTPHFHKNTGNARFFKSGEGWQILEETDGNTKKDTGLMLQAGAAAAYLLQAEEKNLFDGFQELMKQVPEGNLIVCESAGLKEYVEPGVFLVLRQLNCNICSLEDNKLFDQADRIVTFTTNGFDFSPDEISIFSGKWKVKK
jgi:hypothetical protein